MLHPFNMDSRRMLSTFFVQAFCCTLNTSFLQSNHRKVRTKIPVAIKFNEQFKTIWQKRHLLRSNSKQNQDRNVSKHYILPQLNIRNGYLINYNKKCYSPREQIEISSNPLPHNNNKHAGIGNWRTNRSVRLVVSVKWIWSSEGNKSRCSIVAWWSWQGK